MKRIFASVLTLCLIFSIFSISALASSHLSEGGLDFDHYTHKKEGSGSDSYYGMDSYQSVKRLDKVPHTFEAWIYAEFSGWEGGVILGNNSAKSGGRFTFTLNKDFYPELTFKDRNGATHSAVFKNADVPPYSWAHLVIIFDEAEAEFRCYVNGEFKESIAFSDTCPAKCKDGCVGIFSLSSASHYPFLLGGDLNYLNPNYFRGYIQDVALYSDVLSDSEIALDFQNGVNAEDENLILYYDIDSLDKGKDIEDLSGNGYDLVYSKAWLTEEEMEAERNKKGFTGDYDYSIAVIGDPQYATKSNPEAVRAAYSWIAENKDGKNIQYVIGLGDLTDQCQEKEWLEAADALKILEDAGIYYSLVRGNHDTAVEGGISDSSRPTAKPELFDELFAQEDGFYMSQFKEYGGLYEEGSVKNTYRTLDFEGNKWLILNLDWRVEEGVFEWAKEIIESHSEHRVIIVTHDYLGGTGNQSSNGTKIWDNLAGQYENVVLVLGGHNSWDNINVNQAVGTNGNTVTQMLIDPQRADYLLSGVGIVTMFYFSENGSVVDVEHYSPEWDRYFKNINQLKIDLKTERFKDSIRTEDPTPPPAEDDNGYVWVIVVSAVAAATVISVFAFFFIKARKKSRVE